MEKEGLIVCGAVLPILVATLILSPLGVITTKHLSETLLLWCFAAFLIFAGSMVRWYKHKEERLLTIEN
jgi:uncharacterized membrane protein YfcA